MPLSTSAARSKESLKFVSKHGGTVGIEVPASDSTVRDSFYSCQDSFGTIKFTDSADFASFAEAMGTSVETLRLEEVSSILPEISSINLRGGPSHMQRIRANVIWKSEPAFEVRYRWYRSDSSGTWLLLPGVRSDEYQPSLDDVGRKIKVSCVALNTAGLECSTASAISEVVSLDDSVRRVVSEYTSAKGAAFHVRVETNSGRDTAGEAAELLVSRRMILFRPYLSRPFAVGFSQRVQTQCHTRTPHLFALWADLPWHSQTPNLPSAVSAPALPPPSLPEDVRPYDVNEDGVLYVRTTSQLSRDALLLFLREMQEDYENVCSKTPVVESPQPVRTPVELSDVDRRGIISGVKDSPLRPTSDGKPAAQLNLSSSSDKRGTIVERSDDDDIVLQGWLHRESLLGLQWKKRWVVLRAARKRGISHTVRRPHMMDDTSEEALAAGGAMHVYSDPADVASKKEPLGVIFLKQCIVTVAASKHKGRHSHRFAITGVYPSQAAQLPKKGLARLLHTPEGISAVSSDGYAHATFAVDDEETMDVWVAALRGLECLRPLRQGWLRIQRHGVGWLQKRWQKRWCVLKAGSLTFATKEGGVPCGIIRTNGAVCSAVPHPPKKYADCVLVSTPKLPHARSKASYSVYALAAAEEGTLALWIRDIQGVSAKFSVQFSADHLTAPTKASSLPSVTAVSAGSGEENATATPARLEHTAVSAKSTGCVSEESESGSPLRRPKKQTSPNRYKTLTTKGGAGRVVYPTGELRLQRALAQVSEGCDDDDGCDNDGEAGGNGAPDETTASVTVSEEGGARRGSLAETEPDVTSLEIEGATDEEAMYDPTHTSSHASELSDYADDGSSDDDLHTHQMQINMMSLQKTDVAALHLAKKRRPRAASLSPSVTTDSDYEDVGTIVVFDHGSEVLRAGLAGEDLPRCVIPVSKQKSSSHSATPAMNPDSMEVDWDAMSAIWREALSQLRVRYEDEPVSFLATEMPDMTPASQAKMAGLFFGLFRARYVKIVQGPVMALFGGGMVTGLGVDLGNRMQIAPVVDGYIVRHACHKQRSGVAGRAVTHHLAQALLPHGISVQSLSQLEEVDAIKQKYCHVLGFEEKRNLPKDGTVEVDVLGHHLTLGNELRECVEPVFEPVVGGRDEPGLAKRIEAAIAKCSIDSHRSLWSNIVLCGGTTLIPGLPERLESELKSLMHGRRRDVCDVRVSARPSRRFMVWMGAALFADICAVQNTVSQNFVSREDYEASGEAAIYSHLQ